MEIPTDASSRQNMEQSINECDNEYTHSVCALSDLPVSLDEAASEQQSIMPTPQQSSGNYRANLLHINDPSDNNFKNKVSKGITERVATRFTH